MKPITKLYLKHAAILIAVNSAFIVLTIYGVSRNKCLSIAAIILFLLVTLYSRMESVSRQKRALKALGVTEFTDETLNVNQEREIKSSISMEELLRLLKNDPYTSTLTLKQKDNKILLQHNLGLWQGENISIQMATSPNNLKRVVIASKPQIPTLFDNGRNTNNVDYIENLIANRR